MNYAEVLDFVQNKGEQVELYIRESDDNSIFAIVLMTTFESDNCDGDYESFGAYYGYQGGGVNDGGFFKLSAVDPMQQVYEYDDLDSMDETEVNIYEALMQELWTIVDDEDGEGDLSLTDKGLSLVEDNGGFVDEVVQLNNFDGDSLDGLAWGLLLHFES